MHVELSDDGKQEKQESVDNEQRLAHRSRIRRIRCVNLAGLASGESSYDAAAAAASEIILNFDTSSEDDYQQESNSNDFDLIAITGETGSGKSLLVRKVADLVTGGKVVASLIDDTEASPTTTTENQQSAGSPTTVEMTLSLHDPLHLSMVVETLEALNLDPTVGENLWKDRELTLTRVMSRSGQWVKSVCFLNGHAVPFKTLNFVGGSLVVMVDAPAAASALAKASSRLTMLDTGVPTSILQLVRKLQAQYRHCKQYRQSLEQELASLNLPTSMKFRSNGSLDPSNLAVDDRDLDLFRHWVKELDGFEKRMNSARDLICNAYTHSRVTIGDPNNISATNGMKMALVLSKLEGTEWMTNDSTDSTTFSSSFYRLLLDLSEEIKSMDGRILSATKARDSLSSLSAPDSAYTALDRARKLLLFATHGLEQEQNKVAVSAERAHELLNEVEEALLECGACLDRESTGLLACLQEARNRCPLSPEELLEYITEWNALARKHGVSPYQLPSCHSNLKMELDGGVEARTKLPIALEAENTARQALRRGCQMLTQARFLVCEKLSNSISQQLPDLGLVNSRFEARLRTIPNPLFGSAQLGVDEVDFFLFHSKNGVSKVMGIDIQKGYGRLENVASSGEKARILLAIECLLPGSVRALCGASTDREAPLIQDITMVSPVAVIYDEIDAHVGGRASILVAQMLLEQSRSCQVLSITHSASLAALANRHLCVAKKSTDDGEGSLICVKQVDGVERQKELARMASGDMASEEAELFAKALLRDASLKGKRQNSTSAVRAL